jgi:hypothetical protein
MSFHKTITKYYEFWLKIKHFKRPLLFKVPVNHYAKKVLL